MSDSPTVYVVDDNPDVRKSIGRLLAMAGLPMEEFDSAAAFLEKFDPSKPGCLLLDVRMPGMSGLELQQHLRAKGVNLPVIIITGHGDVPMAVEAFRGGAIDFVEKPFRAQVLIDRIREAVARDAEQRASGQRVDEIRKRLERLTAREREVVDLLATGLNNKQVAMRLGVSPQAIDATRSRAFSKIEIDSVAELVRLLVLARVIE